ncbi:MAG: transcription antitermination factor NusB [Bacteroidota bacterium]
MLNRRYLRVKVFQALYAFFQTEDADLLRGEKEMFKSIDRIYDLYLYWLWLVVEVVDAGRKSLESAREKRLPTEADLNPNTRFVDNRLVHAIESNTEFRKMVDRRKVSWHSEYENVRKLFRKIRDTEAFERYMHSEEGDFEQDREFILSMFNSHIGTFEIFHHYLEEKSIYWYDDLALAAATAIKTMQHIRPNANETSKWMPALYKDAEDDRSFVKELFRKTIRNSEDYAALISQKTQNWEVERIALLDVILMKMALCEFEHFSTIPVKVSLNEYIELAKSYSTPKSKVFINGILDKLLIDMKADGRIRKTGRGLIG